MKKNSGITLIALIVTIIIISILAGVVIAQLTGENGLLNRTKRAAKQYEINQAKEELQIKINELQLEEQLRGEEFTKEDLPKLNSDNIDVGSVENFPVEIIYGKYKFAVDENFIVTYIGEADGTIVTYTTEPEGYTNQDEIKILIKIENPNGIKTIEYPNGDKLSCYGKTIVVIDYKANKNGSYIFKIIDKENNEITKDIFIDLIDKIAPLEFTPEATDITETSYKIKANAEDAEKTEESTKSGIGKYTYYITDKSNNNTEKYDSDKGTLEMNDVAIGTYTIKIKAVDRAGNETESNSIEVEITKMWEYELADGVVTLTSYIGNNPEVTVPATYKVNGVEYPAVLLRER